MEDEDEMLDETEPTPDGADEEEPAEGTPEGDPDPDAAEEGEDPTDDGEAEDDDAEDEGEGVLVGGEIYHVRGCPILPGKETVTLDYIEE